MNDDLIHKVEDNHPIVKIDCYGGDPSWDNGVCASAGFANEKNHDEYFQKFMAYACIFIEATGMGVKEALNIILTTRNSVPDRDRMRAAKRCAAVAPQLKTVREYFEDRGFWINVDPYDFNVLWLMFGKNEGETACVDVTNPDNLGVGSGDGYHRSTFPSPGTPYTVKDLDGFLPAVVEECGDVQMFLQRNDLCAYFAKEFIKEIDLDITFLTDGIYVYYNESLLGFRRLGARLFIVFGDDICLYRNLSMEPEASLDYLNPSTTPEALKELLIETAKIVYEID